MSRLDEILRKMHNLESTRASAADQAAEAALDNAANVPRINGGPGFTESAARAEQRGYEQEAADHRHRARVHRRRAEIAKPDGTGCYPQTDDELRDGEWDIDYGDARSLAHSQGRVHHGGHLPRQD